MLAAFPALFGSVGRIARATVDLVQDIVAQDGGGERQDVSAVEQRHQAKLAAEREGTVLVALAIAGHRAAPIVTPATLRSFARNGPR